MIDWIRITADLLPHLKQDPVLFVAGASLSASFTYFLCRRHISMVTERCALAEARQRDAEDRLTVDSLRRSERAIVISAHWGGADVTSLLQGYENTGVDTFATNEYFPAKAVSRSKQLRVMMLLPGQRAAVPFTFTDGQRVHLPRAA